MSEVSVLIHLPHTQVHTFLTTAPKWSPQGDPRLVLFRRGDDDDTDPKPWPRVGHRSGDWTTFGPAGCLVLLRREEPGEDDGDALTLWREACRRERAGWPVTMAENWLARGGWEGGRAWHQPYKRSLERELNASPFVRVSAVYVPDRPGEAKSALAWVFPDGGGVVRLGRRWTTFNPNGRTPSGRVELADGTGAREELGEYAFRVYEGTTGDHWERVAMTEDALAERGFSPTVQEEVYGPGVATVFVDGEPVAHLGGTPGFRIGGLRRAWGRW